MPRRAAIRFDHHGAFVDFVRQFDTSAHRGGWSLAACDAPDGLGRIYYLTSEGDDVWTREAAARGWQRVEVALDNGRVVDGKQTLEIDGQRQAPHLTLLVGPDTVERERVPELVVLWCQGEDTFQRLIGMSLRLGCDRLQYATLTPGEHEEAAFLIRGERLSYFVLDTALDAPDVKVYVPRAEGALYLEWGTEHPLMDQVATQASGQGALFFDGARIQARARRVALPAWKDVYQLTRFELTGLREHERWSEADASPGEFTVTLRLAPAHVAREPYLWLLPEREQARVERLLHAIPEPDLDNLHFTAQETPDGARFIIIRERHTGVGREYIDFEGTQLGPYAGYPNLMIPVDQELEPQLRKDRYRDLFALRSGSLSLLWDDQGQLRLAHLQERAFRPLREFVDYIVGADGQELDQIIARAVFDFQDYRFARAAHTPRAKERPEASPEELEPWDSGPDDGPAPEPTQKVKKERKGRAPAPQRPAAPKPEDPGELERREIEAEGALIVKGQSVERWETLARVKEQRGKHNEAAMCWFEAMWLSIGDPAQAERLEESFIKALERSDAIALEGATPAERTQRLREQTFKPDSDPRWALLWVTHGARHLRQQPDDARSHVWLTEGHKLLGSRAAALRKKERWLLWGRLIGINRDAVEEARVREELLDELNQRGLRPSDIPQFIQNRIYQSRLLDDSEASGGSEARAAMRILERIQNEINRAEDDTLRVIGDALLSYGFERLGDRARAADHASRAERTFEGQSALSGIERAWVALYLGAGAEVVENGSGRTWLDRFDRLFRQHSGGDLFSSELEAIQKHLLERATSDSPTKFLDPENFRSLYPSSQKYTRSQAIRHEIEAQVQRGEFDRTLETLQTLATRASRRELNLDTRELAWLLQHVVIKTMRRIGRAAEGGPILQKFEQGRIDPSEDTMGGFYPTLYMLTLGEGYLDLGEEQRGIDLVCGAIRSSWTNEPGLQWLDHLDMLAAALGAIEMAPIEHRTDAVNEVLQALFLDRRHRSDGAQYRPIKLRLLDHCLEVGLSKEKLSLKRYKNYMEEDEFHVRQRIITEKLT